ncbi:MAG: hypothetical protein AABZ61_10285 [Bacteroidota bacterium]
MRRISTLFIALFILLVSSATLTSQTASEPYSIAYYYKVKWGYFDEFVQLFKKNHYPILKAEVERGKLLSVKAYQPQFHGEGRADWHFLVVITYKNWAAIKDTTGGSALVTKLYPDQEKFKKEEQRRFEILDAHWDVPLNELDLEK